MDGINILDFDSLCLTPVPKSAPFYIVRTKKSPELCTFRHMGGDAHDLT